MGLRSVLAGLIVVATVAFVIGISIERGDSEANHAEGGAESGESAEHRAAEGTDQAGAGEREEEFMPFGIDDESNTALAILAAIIALLHLGAAAVAMLMIRGARRDDESPAPAAAMRA